MAKISDSEGRRDENSGYIRLFGNVSLGHLISRVQSAVIRAGNELEELIKEYTMDKIKADIKEILIYQGGLFAEEVQVVFQPVMPGEAGEHDIKSDILVVDHKNKTAKVIELKDGDTFDTKKSSGELESMQEFARRLNIRLHYNSDFFFCCFNQDDKKAICIGAKNRFGVEHAMTGKELCTLLNIDYDALRKHREGEQQENMLFFLSELFNIPEVRNITKNVLK